LGQSPGVHSPSVHQTVSSARSSQRCQVASGAAAQRARSGSVMSALIVKPIGPGGPSGRGGWANHFNTRSS